MTAEPRVSEPQTEPGTAASPALARGDTIEALLRRAELEAERVIAFTRIGIALALIGILVLSAEIAGADVLAMLGTRVFGVALLSNLAFLALGLASWGLVRSGRFRPWMSWLFVSLDVLILTVTLDVGLEAAGVRGNFLALLPPVLAGPAILAVGALRYRPGVQLYLALALVAGYGLVAATHDFTVFDLGPMVVPPRLFTLPPNLARLTLLLLTGLVTVLVVIRARRHLEEAVQRTLQRAALARFLPVEFMREIDAGTGPSWREGRRQVASVVFVDIRDSTAIGERMDPGQLAVFINSFRRRVMAAANRQGGMVDKFVGDGALLIFGVPEPRADDASRAIAFARDLLAAVERWNVKRRFNPPLRIGIGIHTGEVYVGLLGSEDRLEFTVLGDSVNIAARLEQATKDYPADLIISRETLAAANMTLAAARHLGTICLRGRAEETDLYALALNRPRLRD